MCWKYKGTHSKISVNMWSAKTYFKNSNTLAQKSGIQGKTYDVNLQSVHAAIQGMGQARLEKVGDNLNLPKPVNNNHYRILNKNFIKSQSKWV